MRISSSSYSFLFFSCRLINIIKSEIIECCRCHEGNFESFPWHRNYKWFERCCNWDDKFNYESRFDSSSESFISIETFSLFEKLIHENHIIAQKKEKITVDKQPLKTQKKPTTRKPFRKTIFKTRRLPKVTKHLHPFIPYQLQSARWEWMKTTAECWTRTWHWLRLLW